jgi:hypothetical protein
VNAWQRFPAAVCALSFFMGMTAAVQATTNRIVFSGAVVEPTCSGEAVASDLVSSTFAGPANVRLNCGRTATDPGRVYLRTVIRLSAADLEQHRLLAYFASYARREGGGGDMLKVVVNTYE